MQKISSMTGFASCHYSRPLFELEIDLKTVNGRFLEIYFKIPDSLRHLEAKLRQCIQENLSRGKVELYIGLEKKQSESLTVDHEKLGPILKELTALQGSIPSSTISLSDLLQLPGVLISGDDHQKEIDEFVLSSLKECVDKLLVNRQGEGDNLREAITKKLNSISGLLDVIEKSLSQLVEKERERLRAKFEDLRLAVDEARLEQEIVLAAQKSDIAEEYDRLRSHVKGTLKILEHGGQCGKKLDFMMQEFNREANTMASKANTLEITQSAVELKVLIEQMREQVQNID